MLCRKRKELSKHQQRNPEAAKQGIEIRITKSLPIGSECSPGLGLMKMSSSAAEDMRSTLTSQTVLEDVTVTTQRRQILVQVNPLLVKLGTMNTMTS
jgi:hypothetical protein